MHGVADTKAGDGGGAMLARRASARRRQMMDASEAAVRRELAWTVGVCVVFIVAVNLLAAWLGVH
ncbi:MAG TPA: hypothetical protein VMU06_00145 [Stellaceae bacterium]|nr:hypothetical protein [Stellaceae bacterium]